METSPDAQRAVRELYCSSAHASSKGYSFIILSYDYFSGFSATRVQAKKTIPTISVQHALICKSSQEGYFIAVSYITLVIYIAGI